MKKVLLICLLLLSGLLSCHYKRSGSSTITPLPSAPKTLERYGEIAIQYNDQLAEHYNKLAPEERVLLYYLYRASLPGNCIFADQVHRDANKIIDLFFAIINNKEKLLGLKNQLIDMPSFLKQAEYYFVYLWTNHGHYFEKEFINNKRTPKKLNLDLITPANLTTVLGLINYPNAAKEIEYIGQSLFDQDDEPTTTIPNNIQKSAANIYAPDFTEEDYQQLPAHEQQKLNNYFFVAKAQDKRMPKTLAYKVNGKYDKELRVVCHWLTKAHEHTKKNPQYFDQYLTESLRLLHDFFKTGDEEVFKKHCIAWLKSTSKIAYNLGFIEVYKDPKGVRGFFQGDATIKSVDLTKLNTLLPVLEQALPIPQEFKRNNITTLPNASINCKVFGTGDLGPLHITAAYCLPNYTEVRATHGSKQVMYKMIKQLPLLINPTGYRTLFFSQDRAQWLEEHSPECTIIDDIWELHCLLHETIGHGSGKHAMHTIKEGDPLTIEGKTYTTGDIIPVTSSNESLFLAGYESTIEELRAEIISLQVMLTNVEKLIATGFLQKWAKRISQKELLDWCIHTMLHDAYRRLFSQNEDNPNIAGDHARADWTIYAHLFAHDCFKVVEQSISFDGQPKTIIEITDINIPKTIAVVTELMQEVQRIKSTGDGQAAKKLVDGYCKPIQTPHYIKILKDNLTAIVGDLKVSAVLEPLFTPVLNPQKGTIDDIQASWPKDIFQLARYEHTHKLLTD